MAAVVEDVLATRLSLLGLSQYTGGLGQAVQGLDLLGSKLDETAKKQLSYGVAAGAVSLGIGNALGKAVARAGDLQQIEVGFKSVLGSAEAARAKMAELEQFSAKSPFDFDQSAAGAQQLLAMGVAGKDLIPIMTAAGNATAAAGKDSQTFGQVLRAIGQIKTKGVLQGDELLQLSESGIPAMQVLQEELHLTSDQMRNLGKQAIPADVAIQALVNGLNRKFGGAMADQANTLTGSLSNLRDVSNKAWSDLGKPLVPWTTGAVKGVTDLIDAYNKAPEAVHNVGTAAAVAGTVGFGALGIGLVGATVYGKLLSIQVGRLQKDQLEGKTAAKGQGEAEWYLAEQLGVAEGATVSLIPHIRDLEKAHWDAARAAKAQATAEGGGGAVNLPDLGGGTGKGKGKSSGGAVSLPDLGGSHGTAKPSPGRKTPAAAAQQILTEAEEDAAKIAAAAAQKASKTPSAALNTAGELTGDAVKLSRGAKLAKAAGQVGSHLKGGAAALVTDLALNWALDMVPDEGPMGVTKHLTQGALQGAGWGATIGSFFPGVGTAAGAAIGGTIGAGKAGWDEWQKTQPHPSGAKADPSQDLLNEMKKQTDLLREIQKNGTGNSPIGYRVVSDFEQKRELARVLGRG